jgi:hypothetical protein
VKGTRTDPIGIQDGGGFGHILLHLLDERLSRTEGLDSAKPPDQIDAQLFAI